MSRTSWSSSLSPEESHTWSEGGALRIAGKVFFRSGKLESSEEDEGDAEDALEEWCKMVETRPVFTL